MVRKFSGGCRGVEIVGISLVHLVLGGDASQRGVICD